MLRAVEGVYRDGKVELLERPADISEGRVIVTFLPATTAEGAAGAEAATPGEVATHTTDAALGAVDLRSRGIDETAATSLRVRLRAFEEDWEREEMAAYDAL
jgi:hypothetical protein